MILTIQIAAGVLIGLLAFQHYSKDAQPWHALIADFVVWFVFVAGTIATMVWSGMASFHWLLAYDLQILFVLGGAIFIAVIAGLWYLGFCFFLCTVKSKRT